ncbi:MAG: L,D-transpeptidase family protein [Actinophytocola sp.]|nr:L,D-transpeptidase family protein [Actinophytocola sp.]
MIGRRTVLRTAALAGGGVVVGGAAACSGDDEGVGTGGAQAAPKPVAVISSTPADGAKNVGVKDKIVVRVEQGTLEDVALTNADGKQIAGELAEDKRSWRVTEPLGFGKKYRYTARAVGTDNKQVEATGSFTMVTPASEVRATINPIDDVTVGVAMPISVRFDVPVTDKAAAERALSVESDPPVEGAWAWLHDRQVDWRPREYWPEGTKVKAAASLYGVHYGGGSYGRADLTTEFRIGRNQVVKIHTPDHEMRVYRDGELFATYPSSNGKDKNPDLNTPNGTMIVMAKHEKARFDNARYGYTNVWKKWAVRFSNHGEFIHENDDNRANIGKKNTSHGCVNLLNADAKEYYQTAMIGDPVEVTGAKQDMPTTSDVNDWLFDWRTWKSMSAL